MEEEKFWTKTRIIIIAAVVAVILIVIGCIFIHRNSMIKKYKLLESQINNAAPILLLTNSFSFIFLPSFHYHFKFIILYYLSQLFLIFF